MKTREELKDLGTKVAYTVTVSAIEHLKKNGRAFITAKEMVSLLECCKEELSVAMTDARKNTQNAWEVFEAAGVRAAQKWEASL